MPTDDLTTSTGEEVTNTGAAGTGGAEGAPAAADAKGAAVASSEAGKTGKEGAGETGAVPKTVASGGEDDEAAKAKAAEADANAKAAARAEEIKTLRERLAQHASAGDKKAYDKELKRLERLGIEKPEQIYGLYRELDNKLNGGGLIKVPGKDAKPEDVAEFHKAIGVPEKVEDLIGAIKLENGAVIGEADKPVLDAFAAQMHKAGATPAVMSAAVQAYYDLQAQSEADKADADDEALRQGIAALKEELGGNFRRETAAIKNLFDTAPGGADDKNPASLYSRVMTARTQDGKLLGNDLDFLKMMMAWRQDIRPFATVTEDGAGSAKTAEARLQEIRDLRKSDPRRYRSDAIQKEELGLIDSLLKAGLPVPA